MAEMRSTERLLEVIEERSTAVREWVSKGHPNEASDQAVRNLAEVLDAIDALRSRGDTVVRRNDLRVVRQAVDVAGYHESDGAPNLRAALSHVDKALDG